MGQQSPTQSDPMVMYMREYTSIQLKRSGHYPEDVSPIDRTALLESNESVILPAWGNIKEYRWSRVK